MFRFAVFSEAPDRCSALVGVVNDFLLSARLPGSVRGFDSCAAAARLTAEIANYDIALIDFAAVRNAAQLASRLCDLRPELVWVCVGLEQELLNHLLILRPSGYIAELTNVQGLQRLLTRLIKREQQLRSRSCFSLKSSGELLQIPYEHISYFESSAKKVTLHLYNSPRKYYFSAKLDDIEQVMPYGFVRCHQSFLVNMRYIRSFDLKNGTITVLPNEEVLVSRRMGSAAKRTYEAYLALQK